jgi:hypothetical protein
MRSFCYRSLAGAMVVASAIFATFVHAQSSRFNELANAPFTNGFLSNEAIASIKDELVFQRAVQSYLWALPVLNMYGMKDGSEKVFGKGYNVLPIFKDRLNAKTLITTPNSDVIYALEEVGKALRAGTNCGSCLPELRKIIQAQVPQTA